jgi:anti-sigma factor (TIGR02949 family)
MKCEDARELITGLIDGELSAAERQLISSHLQDCPKCQWVHQQERALKEEVRTAAQTLSAPPGLRNRILAGGSGLPEADDRHAAPRIFGWLSRPALRPAFALLGLLVLALALVQTWRSEEKIALSALELHREIDAGKVSFVKGLTQEEIKNDLQQAVGGRFSPMAYDLSMLKLRPMGGVDRRIGDRVMLVTIFQGDGPSVTCYTFLGTDKDVPDRAQAVFDPEKKLTFYAFTREGVNGVFHRDGEIICILVSTMPMSDLIAIARAKARHA